MNTFDNGGKFYTGEIAFLMVTAFDSFSEDLWSYLCVPAEAALASAQVKRLWLKWSLLCEKMPDMFLAFLCVLLEKSEKNETLPRLCVVPKSTEGYKNYHTEHWSVFALFREDMVECTPRWCLACVLRGGHKQSGLSNADHSLTGFSGSSEFWCQNMLELSRIQPCVPVFSCLCFLMCLQTMNSTTLRCRLFATNPRGSTLSAKTPSSPAKNCRSCTGVSNRWVLWCLGTIQLFFEASLYITCVGPWLDKPSWMSCCNASSPDGNGHCPPRSFVSRQQQRQLPWYLL